MVLFFLYSYKERMLLKQRAQRICCGRYGRQSFNLVGGVELDIFGETGTSAFKAMSAAMVETLVLYLALPLVVAGLLARYVFRLRGQAFNIVFGILAIACMYLFVYEGIPHYQLVYEAKLSK